VSNDQLAAMVAHPYGAANDTDHIAYKNDYRYPAGIEAPYVAATTLSLLLSSRRVVQLLGAIVLVGFAAAYVSFHQSYISVWCFFAAVASGLVYLHISQVLEPQEAPKAA
jgi:hypothetical protein